MSIARPRPMGSLPDSEDQSATVGPAHDISHLHLQKAPPRRGAPPPTTETQLGILGATRRAEDCDLRGLPEPFWA